MIRNVLIYDFYTFKITNVLTKRPIDDLNDKNYFGLQITLLKMRYVMNKIEINMTSYTMYERRWCNG